MAKRLRVVRTLIYNGTEDWITACMDHRKIKGSEVFGAAGNECYIVESWLAIEDIPPLKTSEGS